MGVMSGCDGYLSWLKFEKVDDTNCSYMTPLREEAKREKRGSEEEGKERESEEEEKKEK